MASFKSAKQRKKVMARLKSGSFGLYSHAKKQAKAERQVSKNAELKGPSAQGSFDIDAMVKLHGLDAMARAASKAKARKS